MITLTSTATKGRDALINIALNDVINLSIKVRREVVEEYFRIQEHTRFSPAKVLSEKWGTFEPFVEALIRRHGVALRVIELDMLHAKV